MSVEKTLVRSHVFNELGNKTEDLLERYRQDLGKAEGVVSGLGSAQQALEGVLRAIDVDVDAHRLDLEQGKLAKTWVLRAGEQLATQQTQASARVLLAHGRIEAIQGQLQMLKQQYDVEKARLAQYTAPPTPDNVISIEGKERPRSLKARRLQGEGQDPAPKKKRGRKPKLRPTGDESTQLPAQSQTAHMPPGPYTDQPVSTEESS